MILAISTLLLIGGCVCSGVACLGADAETLKLPRNYKYAGLLLGAAAIAFTALIKYA